jgi:hypothetical protein
MGKESSLTSNILCLFWAIAVLAFVPGDQGASRAFLLAYPVGIAVILFNAYRVAAGDSKQILANPVTAALLLAVFDSFGMPADPLHSSLYLLLMAVALGASVLAVLAPGRPPLVIFLAGPVVGWLGVLLTSAALDHHLPGSGLFVRFGDIPKFDPLHLDYLRGRTDAELQDMIQHNGVGGSGVPTWKIILFVLQTVALSAWDALILSLGVWIVGLIAAPVTKLFAKKMPEAT